MIQRTRQLVSPATRGHITRALRTDREWRGRRQGVKMQFFLMEQPDLEGRRIKWRARIQKKWTEGVAGTVPDAVAEIEKAAAA